MPEHPRWTAEPPSEPGLYWFALIDSKGMTRHCRVYDADGVLVITTDGGPCPVAQMHRVWAGPLREPVGEATHDV